MLLKMRIEREFKLGIKFKFIQLNHDKINHIPIIYEQNNGNKMIFVFT